MTVRAGGVVRPKVGVRLGTPGPGPNSQPGSWPPSSPAPSIGLGGSADTGPANDMLVVYDAHDYPSSSVYWRGIQKNGLGMKLPLLERFKKDVEKEIADEAKKKNEKNKAKNPSKP